MTTLDDYRWLFRRAPTMARSSAATRSPLARRCRSRHRGRMSTSRACSKTRFWCRTTRRTGASATEVRTRCARPPPDHSLCSSCAIRRIDTEAEDRGSPALETLTHCPASLFISPYECGSLCLRWTATLGDYQSVGTKRLPCQHDTAAANARR